MSKAWERLDMELATLSDSYDDKMVIFLSLLLEPIWLQLFKDKNPALQAENKVNKASLTSRTVAMRLFSSDSPSLKAWNCTQWYGIPVPRAQQLTQEAPSRFLKNTLLEECRNRIKSLSSYLAGVVWLAILALVRDQMEVHLWYCPAVVA